MKKLLRFIPIACAACLITGCAAVTRPVTDVALGAGGAALGGELNRLSPIPPAVIVTNAPSVHPIRPPKG